VLVRIRLLHPRFGSNLALVVLIVVFNVSIIVGDLSRIVVIIFSLSMRKLAELLLVVE